MNHYFVYRHRCFRECPSSSSQLFHRNVPLLVEEQCLQVMLLQRQDDAACTDAGLVGGEVQRTQTGSKVLRPWVDALQPLMGRARGDRGDRGDE